jgi:hypothetical protein
MSEAGQRGKVMDLRKWSKTEVRYGRKLVDSGMEGIRSGEEIFLHGKPLAPFVSRSLGSLPADRQGRASRMLFFGLLGGAFGLGAGLLWQSRRITANAARGALRNVHEVRDEHWVEKHPIAYA